MKRNNRFLKASIINILLIVHINAAIKEESKELIDTDELIQAIYNNNKETALDLIRNKKVNLNFKSKNSQTALGVATHKKHPEIVKLLLEHGADPNIKDKGDWTAMMIASQFNLPEVIIMLLEYGADVNAIDKDGVTALMIASQYNYPHIAKLLLENGADVNIQDKDYWTALIIASLYNLPEVKKLLENNIDVNPYKDNLLLKEEPYDGHINIVKLLLEYGADINLCTKNGKIALDYAIKKRFSDITILLKNWPNICKFTKTFFETNKNYDINNFKLYPTLLDKNHTIKNTFLILRNKNNGNTLLHEAVVKKDYYLIENILNFNVKIIPDLLNTPNNQNMTPIDLSVNDDTILNYFINFAYPTKNYCIIQ